MTSKDKLQIILITYNRSNHVQHTLEQFLATDSPVKNYDLCVLDNNSTDNTERVVLEFIKNPHNVGLSGNIAKALEMANKDYVWVIGDDDIYDFSNWREVENAIEQEEKVICVARYAIPDEYKNDIAYQLFQVTFISGLILKTSLLTDTVIRNVFDSIYTLFPHMAVVVKAINDGDRIYVVNKAISDNGWTPNNSTDVSYVRGAQANELYVRTASMSWIVGYCNILSLLKDNDLKYRSINRSIQYKDIHNGDAGFYNAMKEWYGTNPNALMQLIDVYMNIDADHRKHLLPLIKKNLFGKSFWKKFKRIFFSIKKGEEYNKVRILFFKFKRRKHQ